MLLCLRCSNGDVTLQDVAVTFMLRVSGDEWAKTKAVLVEANLITDDNKPVAWDKRQYASDSSTERVYKHRAKAKQACNDDVTLQSRPVDTDTDTDTEKKKKRSASSSGERLAVDWECPADWIADAMQIKPAWDEKQALDVADGFRDYWIGVVGIKGRKADWRATWRNWVRNQRDIKQARAGPLSAAEDRQRASELLTGRNRGNGERTIDGTATVVA